MPQDPQETCMTWRYVVLFHTRSGTYRHEPGPGQAQPKQPIEALEIPRVEPWLEFAGFFCWWFF